MIDMARARTKPSQYRVQYIGSWGYLLQKHVGGNPKSTKYRPWEDQGHASKAEIALQRQLTEVTAERDILMFAISEVSDKMVGIAEALAPKRGKRKT